MEQYIIQSLKYSPSYKNGLTNHLSMAILALYNIKATDIQISNFVQEYSQKLENINTQPSIIPLQQKYLELINNKDKKISKHEISNIINNLVEYTTAAGFHAIIRVTYILDELKRENISYSNILHELSLALAYWDNTKVKLNYETKNIDLKSSIHNFHNENRDINYSAANLIYQELQNISHSDLYKKYSGVVSYDYNNDTLLLDFALDIYIATRDFTAIHMITLYHAYEIITPYLNDYNKQMVQTILWNNLLAAAIRSHRSKFTLEIDNHNFAYYHTTVIKSRDDHKIKLYYSLDYLNQKYNNPKLIMALNTMMKK